MKLRPRFLLVTALLLCLPAAIPAPTCAQPLPAATSPAAVKPPVPMPEVQKLLSVANKARNTYHWNEALQGYNKALKLARMLHDKAGEAITLNYIGFVYSRTGQPQKALEFYTQALPLHKEVGGKRGEATTLNNIGFVYDNIGQPQKALEFYTQALPLYKEVVTRAAKQLH